MAIVRAGIQISWSSVQRILREKKPEAPTPSKPVSTKAPAVDVKPHHILRPEKPNRTWHLDFTTIDFLWVRFYVAVVLDGFSRKLLGLRVFRDAPTSMDTWRLVRACVVGFGAPRFLVTDHGGQFQAWFRRMVESCGMTLVKGRLRSYQFNGKAERVIKTFRFWQHLTLFAWKIDWIQRKLDVYQSWYNGMRSMWILGGRTPDEVYAGKELPAAEHCRASDSTTAIITARRIHYEGDHHLPLLEIHWTRIAKRSA